MSCSSLRWTSITAIALIATLGLAPLAYAMKGSFAAADANHDGKVTLTEFEAYATRMLMVSSGFAASRFQKMSPAQQAAVLQERFEKADSGHKGYLTPEDWART